MKICVKMKSGNVYISDTTDKNGIDRVLTDIKDNGFRNIDSLYLTKNYTVIYFNVNDVECIYTKMSLKEKLIKFYRICRGLK